MRLLLVLSVILLCSALQSQTAPVTEIEGFLDVHHPNDYTSIYVGNRAGYSSGATFRFVRNAFFGSSAGFNNTTGYSNSFFGSDAGVLNITGYSNAFFGREAGYFNNTGSYNVFFGVRAGAGNRSGKGNVAIGAYAGPSYSNISQNLRLYIDADTTSTIGNDHPLIYGEFDNDLMRVNGRFEVNRANDQTRNLIVDDDSGNLILWRGKMGIGRGSGGLTNKLEVEGEASKSSGGNWAMNSDARLKKDITALDSHDMLDKILAMQSVAFAWDDQMTGTTRPQGSQIGFIAQDLEKIWPEKVSEDRLGYLQTAYGDFDPVFVEAIKALAQENEELKKANSDILERLETLENAQTEN